jgi:hypothetical protein
MSHHSIPTILFNFHTSSPHILWDFWVYSPKKGLSLISCEEGVEGPKDCSCKKIKSNNEPSIWSPRDPKGQ